MLLALLLHAAVAATPQDVAAWIRGLPRPAGQLSQLSLYPGGALPAGYGEKLTGYVRQKLAMGAASAITAFQSGQCTESSSVRVQAPGFTGQGTAEPVASFEGSVFRAESVGCLAGGDIASVEEVYLSPAFRLAEMPQVDGVNIQGSRTCVQSDAVPGLLDATHFCLETRRYAADGVTVIHSALVSNAPGMKPVYYREEILVFAQLPAGVGVYRSGWTRGQDLGASGKALLQSTASATQGRIYRALESWVAGDR